MKILIILFVVFFSSTAITQEKCETSNPEILIDLGGSSKPEKIVYKVDTICEGNWTYCGSGGCSLEVYDDDGNYSLGYLSEGNWHIRPSEKDYENPKKNAFELILPMSKTFCSEKHGKENCSIVVKVIDNKLTEIIE